MEKSEFETAMNWGKTMLGIGPGIEAADYLTVYMRGLRRRITAKISHDAEHEQWIARRRTQPYGNGYRDGFAGIGVAQAQSSFDAPILYANVRQLLHVRSGQLWPRLPEQSGTSEGIMISVMVFLAIMALIFRAIAKRQA
jgi:hypothetical protein